MSAPFEVIAHPLTVWVAPYGTAFPDTATAPVAPWFLLGTNGDKNYDDTGVTVTHGQTITDWTPAGTTFPRKSWRTGETLMVAFHLVDVSAAQYAKIMNDAVVTSLGANDSIELHRGIEIEAHALLARGLSPVDEALAAQYQIPRCREGGSQSLTYNKGTPAALEVQFEALFDDVTQGIGTLVIQSA